MAILQVMMVLLVTIISQMTVVFAQDLPGVQISVNSRESLNEFIMCYSNHLELQSFCSRGTESCSKRCGTFLTKKTAPWLKLSTCSCDSLCRVYDDCCWDFRYACQSEWEESVTTYKQFSQATVECQDGFALISGSPGMTKRPSITDGRVPVISHKEHPGLHFKDIHVFQHFFNNQSALNNALFWKKQLLLDSHCAAFSSTMEVKRFFTHGEISQNLTACVINIASEFVSPRSCTPSVISISCSGAKHQTCPHSGQANLILTNTGQFCRLAHHLQKTHTTTLDPVSSTFQMAGTTRSETTSRPFTTRSSPDCDWVVIRHQNYRNVPVFSVVMSVSHTRGLTIDHRMYWDSRWFPVIGWLDELFPLEGLVGFGEEDPIERPSSTVKTSIAYRNERGDNSLVFLSCIVFSISCAVH